MVTEQLNPFSTVLTKLERGQIDQEELIKEFPDGEFDLLRRFGEVIPVIAIARLLGVPENMANQFVLVLIGALLMLIC